MESRRTIWKIADVLVVTGLLGLAPAWSAAAEGASSKSEDTFAAASQVRGETAQTADDTGTSAADATLDGSAGSVLPFVDIPLAALFLIGVCVLGAGLGPHAKAARRIDSNRSGGPASPGRRLRRRSIEAIRSSWIPAFAGMTLAASL